VLEEKRLRNDGAGAARSEQAGQGRDEVDEKNDQIAHQRNRNRTGNPKELWAKQQFASHKLNSVLGVTGFFNSDGSLKSVGIQCALCHSTVENSLTQGIGHRLDGWANRDLNVGDIVSLAPNLQPFADLLGVDQATVRKVLQSWSLHFSPGIRVERRMVTSLTRNCVSACARHRFILADYVCEYSVFAVFRPECAHATLKGSLGRRIVSMTW